MWSIKSRKKWVATKDLRTRHDHGAADNQVVDYDQPFDVGGYKMMFPGDGSLGAPGHELYNCRCTVVNATDDDLEAEDHMMRVKDPETGRYELVKKKSYREWYDEKQAQYPPEKWAGLAKAGKNYQADQRQYADFVNVLGGKAPKTFAKFQDLKYNDAEKWEYLKGYKRYKVRVPEAREGDYALYQKVKQTGVIGSVRVPPQSIDARTLSFRDDHAARHGCTLDDAIKYISDAKCSIRRKRWDGYSVNYYSPDGAAYVDPDANKIKTAFPASKFDEMTKKVMEVFK